MNDIELFKKKFDPYIRKCLDKKIGEVAKYTKDYLILDYVRYIKIIVLSGGKRIRPYIAYLMYEALGGKEERKAFQFLVSLELFHSFCLVHDDIMDKASLRHGTPTVHKYVVDALKKEKRLSDLKHAGNSQAILIGDLLFSWSQEILNLNKEFDQKIADKVKRLFYEMVDEVTVGQMIDVDITTRKTVSKELIDEKTRLKTAGYSFIKPFQIGAALAGKETSEVEKFCKEFGLRMGIAFQIQDDLFDSSDKSQNQHTYFTYFKSLEKGKKIIEKNFSEAKKLVNKLKIKDKEKKRFADLIEIMEKRTF